MNCIVSNDLVIALISSFASCHGNSVSALLKDDWTNFKDFRLQGVPIKGMDKNFNSDPYAIPKKNMLCNLCCLKTRLRLLCNKYQRHSSLNLVSQQLKLCNISIFGMAYSLP